jgi:NitT/TauT family transport system ATP-binding protein
MREVVDIDIPRPRSLGQNAHLTEVAAISGRLHALLAEKAGEDSAADVRPVDEVRSR